MTDTVHGLQLIARHYTSDFALFEVTEKIPRSYNVYLSGWSRLEYLEAKTMKLVQGMINGKPKRRRLQELIHSTLKSKDTKKSLEESVIVGIHHPMADYKKISISSTEHLSLDCWSECFTKSMAEKNLVEASFSSSNFLPFHWKIQPWLNGTTEPGSSGSGLFNAQGQVIGQLHGGNAVCYNSKGYDLFGAFGASWSRGILETVLVQGLKITLILIYMTLQISKEDTYIMKSKWE